MFQLVKAAKGCNGVEIERSDIFAALQQTADMYQVKHPFPSKHPDRLLVSRP